MEDPKSDVNFDTMDFIHKILIGLISIVVGACWILLDKIDVVHEEVEEVHSTTLLIQAEAGISTNEIHHLQKEITRLERRLSTHMTEAKRAKQLLRNYDKYSTRKNGSAHSWNPNK